ncbi:MAG: DUF4231 domain-containing protein [Clostridia bacterium]|nr:DUF4231 domain-containing protein [Clostridia bacterium]
MIRKIERDYLKDLEIRLGEIKYSKRICSSIKWYISSANFYKTVYFTLNIIAILIPIAGSIASIILSNPRISLFSAVGSGATAILNLSDCQNRWKLYRITAEKLKSVVELYLAEKYNCEDLASECEKIMSDENNSWRNMMERDNKTDDDKSKNKYFDENSNTTD